MKFYNLSNRIFGIFFKYEMFSESILKFRKLLK